MIQSDIQNGNNFKCGGYNDNDHNENNNSNINTDFDYNYNN